jgi:hypothetical protein
MAMGFIWKWRLRAAVVRVELNGSPCVFVTNLLGAAGFLPVYIALILCPKGQTNIDFYIYSKHEKWGHLPPDIT